MKTCKFTLLLLAALLFGRVSNAQTPDTSTIDKLYSYIFLHITNIAT